MIDDYYPEIQYADFVGEINSCKFQAFYSTYLFLIIRPHFGHYNATSAMCSTSSDVKMMR